MSTTRRKDGSQLTSLCPGQLKVQEDQKQQGGSKALSPVFCDFLIICMSGKRVGWRSTWDALTMKCLLDSEKVANMGSLLIKGLSEDYQEYLLL